MKHLIFSTLICVLLLPLSGAQTLIENKKSSFVIVHKGHRSKYGADLIRQMLNAVTGADLPVIHEKEYKKGTPAIFIGDTQAARSKKLIPRSYAQWEHRIDIEKNAVYLTGSDTFGDTLQRGSFESGMLKAVITFLERFANCCFFAPAPLQEYVSKQTKITLPYTFTFKKKPAIEYCMSRSRQLEYDLATNAFYSGSFYNSFGGHSYPQAVPMAKYLKSNPEYFTQNKAGKRVVLQLCFSNKELRNEFTRNMYEHIKRTPNMNIFSVTAYDFPGEVCYCKPCQAAVKKYKTNGAPIFLYVKELAEKVKKDFPHVMIWTYAYRKEQTEFPPIGLKLPDNVIIDFCPIDDDMSKVLDAPVNAETSNIG
jgi:hypothetical protein